LNPVNFWDFLGLLLSFVYVINYVSIDGGAVSVKLWLKFLGKKKLAEWIQLSKIPPV